MTSENDNPIIDTPFDGALSDRYLVYALSTITARSLPDLRDGLKPVHRRLLWAMRQLKLDPAQPHKKSARVVGDVIGKYHPHGDTAAYDAMVRMAQDFSLRYPLVDGQGNFGNIDGDNAAAYRYTEARLTRVAIDLMAGLDEGAADYKPTYNGEEQEPEIMPGLFPALLANGASGIAVGMATNIPPHNAAEILDAAGLLIDKPEAALCEIMAHVRGPDLPTGGLIVDNAEGIEAAYASGRGGFRVRARFADEPEKGEGPGAWQLIVTEIPYGTAKGKLIEQIAGLIADKKLPILEDVRDESTEDVRIVLVPRTRNVDPEILKESLYRLTDLESRISLNLNVLDATRTPRVMGLKEVLEHWLRHQFGVLVRRTQHRLARIDDRLELLAGYIIAYLNLDRIIEIIRAEDEPKPVMMSEFLLNDRQAEAILNMRLRSLRKLEEMELVREREALENERSDLQALLDSPARQRTRMKRDLAKLREVYGPETVLGRRRTTIAEAAPAREIPMEAMIEREPVTVILSKRGWIRAMRSHIDEAARSKLTFKDGDDLAFAVHAQTTDRIILAAQNGRFYTMGADKLPGGRGFGEPIRLMIDIEDSKDEGGNVVAMLCAAAQDRILVASTSGHGFLVSVADLVAETRKGKQVVNLKNASRLSSVVPIAPDHDMIAAVGDNRKLVVFPLADLPEMARGQGVMLQRYKDGGLADATTLKLADGLSWAMGGDSGRTRTESDLSGWRTARGAAGRMAPSGFPRDNRFTPR
ncbi:MAG: DNA topoisomerase IV subunit A [Sphingopyxis sp.]